MKNCIIILFTSGRFQKSNFLIIMQISYTQYQYQILDDCQHNAQNKALRIIKKITHESNLHR